MKPPYSGSNIVFGIHRFSKDERPLDLKIAPPRFDLEGFLYLALYLVCATAAIYILAS